MPLVRLPEAFDHPDWLFELKQDGFRALAYVDGHEFRKWDLLCVEIAHSVRTMHAVLDGEIVCLDREGRSQFYPLLFRRDWPYFYAFDLLGGGRGRPARSAAPRAQAATAGHHAAHPVASALRR
jgi:ATP-dependent DNA ligase